MKSQSTTNIQRALISVSNKEHLIPLATLLIQLDIDIISTGGTAQFLRTQGVKVTEIAELTGSPEMMGGRVKTLHPKIHAALLARGDLDTSDLATYGIEPIQLLIVNLYPFQEVIKQPDCDHQTAIESIDIGGLTLLRSAAKNYTRVTAVSDPRDYEQIAKELKQNGSIQEQTRFYLAQKTFIHTAQYDASIANYFIAYQTKQVQTFPDLFIGSYKKHQELRYGENPQQNAAFYIETDAISFPGTITSTKQLQGKQLSFNNIVDADAALECVKEFDTQPACVIVKHANPCGVATGINLLDAYKRAFTTDPAACYGGIIAFNRALDSETSRVIIEQQYVEVIIAPSIDPDAIDLLSKKPKLRVLSCGQCNKQIKNSNFDYKRVQAGLLVQSYDQANLDESQLQVVTKRQPSDQELSDLLFAWKIVKHVKSNAIVFAKQQVIIGIGAGQMSRVFSVNIASIRAKEVHGSIEGSVMASDAFFPFRDGIDIARASGITAVIQPGGSIRDKEVIAAADKANMAMIFTGIRHFRH